MSKFHMISEKIIKLNVGGTFYTTTKSTLTKVRDGRNKVLYTVPVPNVLTLITPSTTKVAFATSMDPDQMEKSTRRLTKVHGSYIWRIFTGDAPSARDERGSYFIDRDGPMFRYILNYLRSDRLTVPYGFRELHLLKVEADYFGLDGLVQEVENFMLERKRGRRRRPQRKKTSQSVNELHRVQEKNGDLYISDGDSDWFYD